MTLTTRRALRILMALVLFSALLESCALFPRTEPRASQDVLDAIYDGMRRAQEHRPPPAT
jgi:hypothetical protein